MNKHTNLSQSSPYSTTTLLGMTDVLLNRLIENNDCYLCRIYNCQDERCLNVDLCKNLLFDGVLRHALQEDGYK